MEKNVPFTLAQSQTIKKAIYASVPKEQHTELNQLYACLDYNNYSPVKRFEEAAASKAFTTNTNFRTIWNLWNMRL